MISSRPLFLLFAICLLSLAFLANETKAEQKCGLAQGPVGPRPPSNGVRLAWNKSAHPKDPNQKGTYREYFAVDTKYQHVNINAMITIEPAPYSAKKKYAITLRVELTPQTGHLIQKWPYLGVNFINHRTGFIDMVYMNEIATCEKIIYTDKPNMPISDVYVFGL